MNAVSTDTFETMIREAGESHLIDWYAPKAEALPYLRSLLAAADARSFQRFGPGGPRLTANVLVEEYEHNRHKVQAFLQVLASISPDMLVMVWRILQGSDISNVHLEFNAGTSFMLRVRLSSSDAEGTMEEYSSTDIRDVAVLRHLGIAPTAHQPYFDGFYALNLNRS